MATINNQLNIATVPLPVYKTVIDLSSAQLLSLYTTPVLAIPSPGAHKAIIIQGATLEYKFGGSPYTGGSAPWLQTDNIGSGGSNFIFLTLNSAGFGSSSTVGITQPMPLYQFSGDPTYIVNVPIYISNGTSNLSGGNGTMRIALTYNIVSTTA